LVFAAGPSAGAAAPVAKSAPVPKSKRHRRARRKPGQKAPTADRIEEIQSALGREGFYKAEKPSKKWDSASQEAMRQFQEAHGLTGTGKLDALSLQKLGLGSDIAGVSAPRPPQAAHPAAAPPAPSLNSAASNPPRQ